MRARNAGYFFSALIVTLSRTGSLFRVFPALTKQAYYSLLSINPTMSRLDLNAGTLAVWYYPLSTLSTRFALSMA